MGYQSNGKPEACGVSVQFSALNNPKYFSFLRSMAKSVRSCGSLSAVPNHQEYGTSNWNKSDAAQLAICRTFEALVQLRSTLPNLFLVAVTMAATLASSLVNHSGIHVVL